MLIGNHFIASPPTGSSLQPENITISVSSPAFSGSERVAEVLATLDSSTCFSDICGVLNIENRLVSAATYKNVGSKAVDGLMIMVRNHSAMSNLLQRFGQPNHLDDPEGQSISTYSGGLIVSSQSILAELGWSFSTYKNKSTTFAWASRVAHASWRGPEPGK